MVKDLLLKHMVLSSISLYGTYYGSRLIKALQVDLVGGSCQVYIFTLWPPYFKGMSLHLPTPLSLSLFFYSVMSFIFWFSCEYAQHFPHHLSPALSCMPAVSHPLFPSALSSGWETTYLLYNSTPVSVLISLSLSSWVIMYHSYSKTPVSICLTITFHHLAQDPLL